MLQAAAIMLTLIMAEAPSQESSARAIKLEVKKAFDSDERDRVLAELRKLIVELKRLQGLGNQSKELSVVEDMTDNALRWVATSWHRQFKAERDVAKGKYAKEVYRLYVEIFSANAEAYEMRFFFAELLYRMQEFGAAHDEYVTTYNMNPNGKWAEASAEEAVRAGDEQIKLLAQQKQVVGTKEVLADEFTISSLQFRELMDCKRYLAAFPNGKITPPCKKVIEERAANQCP